MYEEFSQKLNKLEADQGYLHLKLKALESEIKELKRDRLKSNDSSSLFNEQNETTKIVSFESTVSDTPPPIVQNNLKKISETAEKKPKKKIDSLELRFGSIWLVRIGIIILLTGLVFFGNFAWTEVIVNFNSFGKLSLIYLFGLALMGAGFFVERKYKTVFYYGQIIIGGGIATIYYATYAAHFVESLRIINNPLIGGVLLTILAITLVLLADLLSSESIASVVISLGFYTAAINSLSSFSLFSNLLLSFMAIMVLIRRKWISTSFLSLIGCYISFIFWRIHTADMAFIINFNNIHLFWTAFLFPLSYWIVFTLATFLSSFKSVKKGLRVAFLTINNGLFFGLTSLLVAGTYSDQFWIFTLFFGGILILLALLAYKLDKEDKEFDRSYVVQGLILIFIGLILKCSGYQLALIFALQSGFLLKVSQYRYPIVLQIFSRLSAVIASLFSLQELYYQKANSVFIAASVAIILIGVGWLLKFQQGLLKKLSFQKRAFFYVLLATVIGIAAAFQIIEGKERLYCFLIMMLVGMTSLYVVRMPEIILVTQYLSFFALAQWILLSTNQQLEIIPSIAILGIFITLLHWWHRQKLSFFNSYCPFFWQVLYSTALIFIIHKWTLISIPNSCLTASWSLLSFGILIIGFLSKIRLYRVLGLFVLLASILRLFYVDVWCLTTIYRILTFLFLGILLLVLGFFYNRFAITIRKYL